MAQQDEERIFGCAACWPEQPEDAWEARKQLELLYTLVERSHYQVTLLLCRKCMQTYVSIFIEIVDWVGGDDSMYSTLLPLRPVEYARLMELGYAVTEQDLNALGPDRRCLRHDDPGANARPRCSWGVGVLVGPHD